ncbi:general substrate transporter [Xylariomycetidae sp. FL0641]|nr:general substrate transporter [Xylariomycetidae sp. FL0641]
MARLEFGFKFSETFNLQLTLSILLICISQLNYGFDNQGFSAIQSLDPFEKQFGEWNDKKQSYELPPEWLSMFNSFGYLGLFVGVVIGSWVSKRYGRRMCMFSMCCWALVTATILVTSKTSDQVMVGRVLNWTYTGMELAVVPIFQSEITPRKARGFVVGTYQLMLTMGGLAINGVCFGTQKRKDNSAWMIPFGLFYIVPCIVICCIWFIPESPRWLYMNGKPEEGLQALFRLREGKFSEEEIAEEHKGIMASIQAEREKEKGTFKDMFQGSNLRRTLIIFLVNFFLQATGQAFSSQYGALFIKSLGTINQFKMQMIQSCVNSVVAIGAMFAIDSVGRRRMLLIGGSLQTAALMAMGALGTQQGSYTINSAIVATMVLMIVGYTFGWAPVVHTLSAELPAGVLRDITYRCGTMINVLTNFAVAFSLPYLMNEEYANLQSKVGFIYGAIAAASVAFAWLFVPDCRGRSLEDVDRLFESGVPARRFHKVRLDPLDPSAAAASDDEENELGKKDSSAVHAYGVEHAGPEV